MSKVRFLHENNLLFSIRLPKRNILEVNLFIRRNGDDELVRSYQRHYPDLETVLPHFNNMNVEKALKYLTTPAYELQTMRKKS